MRTIRSECLDWMLIVNERHLERVLAIFVDHYNQRRRHSTLGQISPAEFERRAITEGMDAMENRTGRGFPPRPHPSVFAAADDRRSAHTA